MEKTDRELVALARSGSKEAFSQLIERHQARVLRVALGTVPNEDVAQELAQEATLQAYLSLDRLREEARFSSWLHGIVLNVCRSYLRDRKRDCLSWESLEWEPRIPIPAAPDPGLVAEQREQERWVLDAVRALSPPNRDATWLFYYEQLSLQEVAASLGISVGAVKGRLHQSRKQLRQRLLPLYPEITALPNRRRKMIKVSVVPLPPHQEDTLDQEDPSTTERHAQRFLERIIMAQSPAHPWEWIGLMEDEGSRFLPLQLGGDARGVAAVLEGATTDVSPALALMASLLQATGAQLEAVRAEPLKDEILHGVIQLRHAGTVREIAARPGDAMALAVQTETPIYVAEAMIAGAGWDLSNALPVVERLRQARDEMSLRTAADEPLIQRVAQTMVENALRYLRSHEGCSASEVVLESNQGSSRRWITMYYRAAGNEYGRNVPLPEAALTVLIARFKLMADLDIVERRVSQQGSTSIQYKGKEYDLRVSTEPTAPTEKLTLRLQQKEGAETGDRLHRME